MRRTSLQKEQSSYNYRGQSYIEHQSIRRQQNLRAQLIELQQENALLKAKAKKIPQLQNKIQMILKHNTELLSENQRMATMLHQKKSEFEVIKNKYESQISQKYGTTASLQFENKKLLRQIQHLNEQINEMEKIKNQQIAQIRMQAQTDLQSAKRQVGASQQMYEIQIRRLKQSLQKKDFQFIDLNNKLKRLSNDFEFEMVEIKDEKQRLKNQLNIKIQQNQKLLKQRGSSRQVYETQSAFLKEQLQTYKYRVEKSELQLAEANNKIKKIANDFDSEMIQINEQRQRIKSKAVQIDQMVGKNSKMKQSYEQNISLMRRQNDNLRARLIEFEKSSDIQIDTLRNKLHMIHETELQQIRRTHQKHIDCLQDEIKKLQEMQNSKSQEIERLIKEKTSTRQTYDSETTRLKEQLETLKYKVKDLENNLRRNTQIFQQKIKDKDNHIQYLDKINTDQVATTQKQCQSLKQLVENVKKQNQSERITMKEKQQRFKQQISDLTMQLQTNKQKIDNSKEQNIRVVEEIREQYDGIVRQLQSKLEIQTNKLRSKQKQLQYLKTSLAGRQKQNKNLRERIQSLNQMVKKLEKDNSQFRNKLTKKDQKTVQLLNEQKGRLQASHNAMIESIKGDHEGVIVLMQSKIKDLNQKLDKKHKQLDQLLKKYKKMKEQMQQLTQLQANKKQLTVKYPGNTADLIATKNLFDVYLKARVLDICQDVVQQKQNKR